MAFSFKIGSRGNGSNVSSTHKGSFLGDDEGDDADSSAEGARARVNAQLAQQAELSRRQTEAASKAALEEDANGKCFIKLTNLLTSTVFAYDEVYDDLKVADRLKRKQDEADKAERKVRQQLNVHN